MTIEWWHVLVFAGLLLAVSAAPPLLRRRRAGQVLALVAYAAGFVAMWWFASEHVR